MLGLISLHKCDNKVTIVHGCFPQNIITLNGLFFIRKREKLEKVPPIHVQSPLIDLALRERKH